jgi:hypothetical protein
VLLAVPPNGDPATLLRRAPGRSSAARRCVVVAANRVASDALASRILAGHCDGTPRAPRALLRAWVAHLASQGQELIVALEDPGGLPLDSARWLGRLVRASQGAARLVLPWAGDPRIWRVIEELGLETEVVEEPPVGAPAPAAAPPPAAPATPRAPATPPAAPRAHAGQRVRVAGGLAACVAGLALLAGTLWWQLQAPAPDATGPAELGQAERRQPEGPPAMLEAEPEAPPTPPEASASALPTGRIALTVRRETTAPERPPGSLSTAEEVARAIRILLADDPGGRHAAAIDRLRALDPAAVAREVLYQFDALTPVGPLAPSRVDEAWEELRVALCRSQTAGGEGTTLPPELGCRPPPSTR